MNVLELPPLVSRSKTNLVLMDEPKKDHVLVKMNGYQSTNNFDSSASSTSQSHSSGGLLIKRSKTSNNLTPDGRLGTLFEHKKSTSPVRRMQRTFSNQRLSNRSDYGSTTAGPARSNNATLGSGISPKRCVSYNDLSKADKNNNRGKPKAIISRHKSEQKLDKKQTDDKEDKKEVVNDAEETEDAREKRILDWLEKVEQLAEPPPEIPDVIEERSPPQTDTAIHIVYDGDR